MISTRRRFGRGVGTVLVSALCLGYIVWKIDLSRTAHVLAHARLFYFVAAVVITTLAILPMAWRWQKLLAARGVHDRLPWLIRSYYVSYAVAQILPTSLGGDASRIFEGSRRHPESRGTVAGSVLLERALGGTSTLTLAVLGFLLAIGRYNVGPYLWIELAFIVGAIVGAVVLFSKRMRRPLARLTPVLRWVRLERLLRTVYEGIHAYREHGGLLLAMFAMTTAVQAVRVSAIWLVAKSVHVDLSPRPFYVIGPMLFLVMLVPFTVNGLAVREAFFVNFLGQLHVGADQAFATGFLFFLVSLGSSIPGAVILLVQSVRPQTSAEDLRTASRT